MNYMIRKMQMEDIQKIQRVAKKSWNSTYEGIIPIAIQDSFLNAAYNDDMLKKRAESSLMFVAVVNENIVGFANFSTLMDGGQAELSAIYLYPQFQGQGIGTALLKEGIENLDTVRELFINVEKENKIGTAFYKAKGFEVLSVFNENFEGHILKTVRMVLKLKSCNR